MSITQDQYFYFIENAIHVRKYTERLKDMIEGVLEDLVDESSDGEGAEEYTHDEITPVMNDISEGYEETNRIFEDAESTEGIRALETIWSVMQTAHLHVRGDIRGGYTDEKDWWIDNTPHLVEVLNIILRDTKKFTETVTVIFKEQQ